MLYTWQARDALHAGGRDYRTLMIVLDCSCCDGARVGRSRLPAPGGAAAAAGG